MYEPFVAEIRIFPFNFAPVGWAFCDGQLLPISQNTTLFSLLGTTYGGDGKTVFALPDLQGAAPMHPGQGPGLSYRSLGETGGSDTVTLVESQMPAHTHALQASQLPGDNPDPAGNYTATVTADNIYAAAANLNPMALGALPPAGGGQPHNNLQPYVTFNFCIALQGIYPSRG